MAQKNKRRISASGIKSFEDCSWKYWNQTILKLPDLQNEGAARGLVVHLVLQLLISKKRKKMVDKILKSGHIKYCPPVDKLVIKHLNKLKVLSPDNYKMVSDMIIVALNHDFFCESGKLFPPEFKFELINQEPFFESKGFIDKMASYKDGKIIKIIDYKTSKFKISGDDKESNNQALLYTWAIREIFKDVKDVSIEFQFLRYPKEARIIIEPTQQQLDGFIHYVGFLYNQIQNLTESKAKLNLAAHNEKKSWLCQKGSWICPFKNPFKYYAILNDDGTILQSSRELNKLDKSKGEIKEFYYSGCPAFADTGEL